MLSTQLARLLYETLKDKGVMTRSQLNILFKADSDQHKAEQLTEVLRSLIVFEHVDRHLDTESNTVYFWLRGSPSPWPASDKVLNSQGVFDWLNKEVRQGVDVPPKKTTPDLKYAVPAPQPAPVLTKVAKDFPPPPPLQSEVDSDGLLALSQGVTLDVFLTRVADKVPSFTQTDIKHLDGLDVNPAVLALRLGTLCSKKVLEHGAPTKFLGATYAPELRKRFVYWRAGKPTPEGITKFDPPVYATKGRKAGTRNRVVDPGYEKSYETTSAPPSASYTEPPQGVREAEETKVPSHCPSEAETSISSLGKITIKRTSGEVIDLSLEESLTVLRMFSVVDADVLLQAMLLHLSKHLLKNIK